MRYSTQSTLNRLTVPNGVKLLLFLVGSAEFLGGMTVFIAPTVVDSGIVTPQLPQGLSPELFRVSAYPYIRMVAALIAAVGFVTIATRRAQPAVLSYLLLLRLTLTAGVLSAWLAEVVSRGIAGTGPLFHYTAIYSAVLLPVWIYWSVRVRRLPQ